MASTAMAKYHNSMLQFDGSTSMETADIMLGVRNRQCGARKRDVPSLSRSEQDSRHGDIETSAQHEEAEMTHSWREQVNMELKVTVR